MRLQWQCAALVQNAACMNLTSLSICGNVNRRSDSDTSTRLSGKKDPLHVLLILISVCNNLIKDNRFQILKQLSKFCRLYLKKKQF